MATRYKTTHQTTHTESRRATFYVVTDDNRKVRIDACIYFTYPQRLQSSYVRSVESEKYEGEFEISQSWIGSYDFVEGGAVEGRKGDIVTKEEGDDYFSIRGRRVYVVNRSKCIFTL